MGVSRSMAQAPEQTKLMTLDELLALGEDARIEIINGEVVEKPMAGATHNVIVGNTFRVLDAHVLNEGIGTVFTDGLTYLMFSLAGGLKDSFMPDVSFVRNENFPLRWNPDNPHPGVPDLAVEVISPSETVEDVQTKLRTYLEKGTEQVWIMYPKTREIHQYRRDNNPEIRIYRASRLEAINAESLFPGLQLTTDDIFKLPTWAQQ